MLWEEMQNYFIWLLTIHASMRIFMLTNICHFQYHLYAEMLLGRYVRYGAHNGAIHFLLLLLTPEYVSRVYIQIHIYNISFLLNVLP